jgi:purine-nucleoside phosphorylase
MSEIPTLHIEVNKQSIIAETVLMPGDPLRAKFIAENFLTEAVKFNSVRNILGYTGYYKGKKVSVMGSGMGMGSMGIYSYELYAFYGVKDIIRIGSAGSYDKNLKIYDIVLAKDVWSESTYAKILNGYSKDIITPSKELNSEIMATAKRCDILIKETRIHSSDVFYTQNFDKYYKEVYDKYGCKCVEMEAFALFANAKLLNKRAACVLTISDSLVTSEEISSEEVRNNFTKMMELVLETIK